jgi:hypothetical protein
MSQANVVTSASQLLWYTDRCCISTTASSVTYQVYATALGTQPAAGNIYSEPSAVDPYSTKQIYVGSGNYLTITGTGFTAGELGTRSSAQASVFDGYPNYTIPYISGADIATQTGDLLITQDLDLLVTN